MRHSKSSLRLVLCAAIGALLLPGTAGSAGDTDLFRTNVPPNILLLVDNSSSMANQVWHQDYGLKIPKPGDPTQTIKARNQEECEYFRETLQMGKNHDDQKFTIFVQKKRASYVDPNGNTMRYRATSKTWETVAIEDPFGTPMFNDLDMDGVQDIDEVDLFYRFANPAISDANWDLAIGADDPNDVRVPIPVLDFYGTQLSAGGRLLYYELKADGNAKGAGAKYVTRIKPLDKVLNAGIDPLTLEIDTSRAKGNVAGAVCGRTLPGSYTEASLWDGDDPLAAAPSGGVMKLRPQYLDWLFSSYGDVAFEATFAPSQGNDGVRTKSGCVALVQDLDGSEFGFPVNEGPTYFSYRRSRIQALTLILRTVICEVNQVGEVRFGFAQFRYGGVGGDDNGGYVAVPINDWFDVNGDPNSYTLHAFTGTHEEHLRRVVRTAAPDAQTPLAEALFQTYTYFMPRTAADLPKGRNLDGTENSTPFPIYNYDTSLYDPMAGYDKDVDPSPPNLLEVGGLYVGPVPPPALTAQSDADSDAAPDPVLYPCQKNFVLYITDGAPSGDDFTDNDLKVSTKFGIDPPIETYTDIGFAEFTTLIGDHYQDGETEETAGTGWKYLDDVSYFMNKYDFRPDMDEDQVIDTYTVGYSLETDSEDLADASTLERAAILGNGKYFESSDADQLAEDIVAAITDMIDKAQAFTSATVPASRTTDGNNFYSSYFLPKADTGFWEGHLKNFEFSAGGDILTSDGHCATGNDIDADPPCAGGALRTFEDRVFWDAATAVPDPDARKLYVEFGATSMFAQPSTFEVPSGQEAAAAATLGLVDGVDTLDEPYASLSPNTPGDMVTALVDVVRGCEFGSSPCVPRLNEANPPQKAYLGDIFHSNPVVVGSPNAPLHESSYHAFASQQSNRERTRVIYAGANDGFLHGFNAGDWQTVDAQNNPLVPPRHDHGTGEELMGFMPYAVRNEIKELPKQDSFPRTMETVDGSPVVGDVWFYRNVSGSDLTTVNPLLDPHDSVAARWRTVLMSGLRDGGETYFALDVTNPPATAADFTTSYPRYLWGFPCEDCINAVNGGTASESTYMGNTWSDPVITRVRVRADNGSDPNGYDRWVAVFGAGYHPHGDPNGSDYREPADAGFAPKGRGIYMLDITTGEVLAKKVFDPTASALSDLNPPQEGVKELLYAVPSSPAVFDLDFDGYADVIYIGDLGGNLWKWVVKPLGDDPINNTNANDDPDQPNWPFRRIFRAGTSLEPTLAPEQLGNSFDDSVHYQSFFFPPTGVLRDGKLVIAFGAGERVNAKGLASEYGDGDATNNNHFYVMRDSDALELAGVTPHPMDDSLEEGDLADLDGADSSLTCSAIHSAKEGYFITGRDAEKFITNSVIFLGTVFTGSFLPPDPNNSNDVCSASGSAFLYAFDLDECGEGHYQSNPGTTADKRRKAIGTGIPTRPRVSVGDLNQGGGGGGPCANRVVVITSDGHIDNDCPGTPPSKGVNVRSWRER